MSRIYDSSQLTKRKAEKAVANSFLTRMYPPNTNVQPQTSYGPLQGIYDGSIMNAVKTGHATEYTRYNACTAISPGCPCPELNASLITLPGPVSNITFTVGSIIISWIPPIIGDGPFNYKVTPYLNGIAGNPIVTSNTSYRFTNLQEWQPYTFTVCAINKNGAGPTVPSSTYFIVPPASLSTIMSGSSFPTDPVPSLKYVINAGLDSMLQYIASVNLGPTKGSRYIYVWITSVVGAWNWIRSESNISGIHDNWDWDLKTTNPLSDNDSIIWLCNVIDYITPFFIPSGYKSIYNCPIATVTRVKTDGEWTTWLSNWETWYNYRLNDGYVTAATTQPVDSANWNETITVDGTTVNNISEYPEPQQWTRLTVQGNKQKYLTYTWDHVISTCLTETDEQTIQDSVSPSIGLARDAEIDSVKDIAANLNDYQKIIAEFWAGGPGTVSPPLMFIWFLKEYIRISDIDCSTIMYSLEDLAIHLFEGGRVTWRLKAAHMEDRPIQEIRRRFTGQQIQSWNGTIDGSQWIPYQEANFITPPFADFPSGHSHFSKAFALTMNKWFGENINKTSIYCDKMTLICPLFTTNQTVPYGDFVINSGSSLIQPSVVPQNTITLSFNKWNEMADQAGISRLYGGIHCLTAHNASQQTAIDVDGYINSTWNIQPSSFIISSNSVPSSVSTTIPAYITAASSNPYKILINYISAKPSQQVQDLITKSKEFLESVISTSHGLRLPQVSLQYDMIVDVDVQSLGSGILASARPTLANASVTPAMPLRQYVILNKNELNTSSLLSTVTFNNTSVVKIIPVLVHEMLHGLGIASLKSGYITVGWDQFLDSSKVWYSGPKNDWTKSEAIKAYREIVGTKVTRIPVENSFGGGTAYSHWEEGLRDGFVKDARYYNYGSGNVFHPALPEEIMTGVAGNKFYFTKMTAGALVDHNYKVNMSSSNIVTYPTSLIQKV